TALVRLILIVFSFLIIIRFFATLLVLLGWRIGIADWPEAPDFGLRKKHQYGSERIFLALSGEAELSLVHIAPIKSALGIAEQHVGGFQKTEAGKHLAGVVKIDGNCMLGHQPSSPGFARSPLSPARSSFLREAC